MRETEMISRAGGALSPAEEMKTAVSGFMSDFKDFRDDIHSKLQQQDEKMTKLDRKMISNRTPLSAAAEVDVPHQKAFAAYVRQGDDDAMRGLSLEGKGLSTAVSADGGYLVDPATSSLIGEKLNATASLRSIASVVQVEAGSFDVLVDAGDIGASWSTETDATSETDAGQVQRVSIPLHELSAMPRASQRLLDDSAFDIESWLAARIADKFARSESQAFVSGDGIGKPKGFLAENIVDESAWNWGDIGAVKTGADGNFQSGNPGDAIVDLVYALGASYRSNATFVMNSKTAAALRKIKDADGRFMWADGMAAGEPARLFGYKVLICEEMPDIGVGANAIAFGDFANGYTIAERPDLRILRDPFSAKPNVLFYANKRVGGGVTDFAAIKLLQFSA